MRRRVGTGVVGALAALSAGLIAGVPATASPSAAASPPGDGRTGPWEPEEALVPEDRVDSGVHPPVAVTADGRAVTVWSLDRPGRASDDLYAHVREPGAAGWSERVLLSGDENVFNAVVAEHRGSNVSVAWQAWDDDHDVQVLTRTLHADGRWSPSFLVAEYHVRPGTGARVELRLDATGRRKVLAWQQPHGLFARVRTADGIWLPASPLPGVGRSGATVAAAVDHEGRAHVLGRRPGQPHNELVHWLLEPGSAAWDPTVIGTLTRRRNVPYPALGSNPAGDLVVSWNRRNPEDGHLQAVVRSRPAGGDWGDDQLLPTRSAGIDLQLDRSGDVTFFWEQRGGGSAAGRLERRTLVGTVSWQRRLGHTSGIYPVFGDLDANDAGQVVVFYRTSRDDGGDLITRGRTVRCDALGDCEPRATGYVPHRQGPQLALGPDGAATFVWPTGCRTEECLPTRVLSRRLLPAP